MTAWISATQLGLAAFAPRLLGRSDADPTAMNLFHAAVGARYAERQGDLREAVGKLAEAIKAVGISQWPRFVVDAVARARDPATVAAVEESKKPFDYKRDAITPVYPVETAIGIAVAGSIAEPAAAARALIGAGVKQALPDSQPLTDSAAGSISTPGTPVEGATNESTEFHDASLTLMSLVNKEFHAQIDDILVDTESEQGYSVMINMTVQSATKDGKAVETLNEQEDSSIIQFTRTGNSANIVVGWHDHVNRQTETHVYSFVISDFSLRVLGEPQ